MWLNKKLLQEFFVGRKDLLEEENYQVIKIIIYKCIHKYKKGLRIFHQIVLLKMSSNFYEFLTTDVERDLSK